MMRSSELARALGVTKNTVLRLANDNLIPSIRLPNGHYRFDFDEVVTCLQSAKGSEDDA